MSHAFELPRPLIQSLPNNYDCTFFNAAIIFACFFKNLKIWILWPPHDPLTIGYLLWRKKHLGDINSRDATSSGTQAES